MVEPVILLVEDSPDDVELTRVALGRTRVTNRLIVVRDGQEALDWLFCTGKHVDREPCHAPAVVLLDLKLPKINGLEVLEKMRANPHTRHIPVVLLTSSKEEQDVAQGYHLGANSFVQKPVSYNDFLEAIQQLGIYWMMLNIPPLPGKGD